MKNYNPLEGPSLDYIEKKTWVYQFQNELCKASQSSKRLADSLDKLIDEVRAQRIKIERKILKEKQ